MKLAICVIAKQENLYLREWIEYYYKMGVANIILYDNNDVNGEYPQNVIGDYIANGFVLYKDVRGKHRYQVTAYNMCYEEYSRNYDWIGFLDVDEYWYLSPDLSFDDFFSEDRFPNAIAVFINWLNYGDNGNVHYENRPVQERFLKPTLPIDFISNKTMCNKVKKVFVKCCGDDIKVVFFDANGLDHYYINEPRKYYAVNGLEYCDGGEDVMDYTLSFIKHYRTLSIEEFLYRRFGRRGYADYASRHNKEEIMQYFWDQNEWTEEKQKVADDFFSRFEVVDDEPIKSKRIFDEE